MSQGCSTLRSVLGRLGYKNGVSHLTQINDLKPEKVFDCVKERLFHAKTYLQINKINSQAKIDHSQNAIKIHNITKHQTRSKT